MTTPNGKVKAQETVISPIRLEFGDVSWAGASSRPDWFSFGCYDGSVYFTDRDGVIQTWIRQACTGAVNGIAFYDDLMAVSSRDSIAIIALRPNSEKAIPGKVLHQGAHGVVRGSKRAFYAPAGLNGILAFGDGQEVVAVGQGDPSTGFEQYYYRVVPVAGSGGQENLVCATRRGGLAVVGLGDDGSSTQVRHLKPNQTSTDIVDVCHLKDLNSGAAVAAVTIDRVIAIIADINADLQPKTICFPEMFGVAYRVLYAQGILFILTSDGAYLVAGIADMLATEQSSSASPVAKLPMTAIDANLVVDRWILITTVDGVLKLDMEAVARSFERHQRDAGADRQTPVVSDSELHFLSTPARPNSGQINGFEKFRTVLLGPPGRSVVTS